MDHDGKANVFFPITWEVGCYEGKEDRDRLRARVSRRRGPWLVVIKVALRARNGPSDLKGETEKA